MDSREWKRPQKRTSQPGLSSRFERLRHQLRHGYVRRIIQELNCLLRYRSTLARPKQPCNKCMIISPLIKSSCAIGNSKTRVGRLAHGWLESACKWLIAQRFKGVGMCWSEDGFNHLLHLRLAWVNQRLDSLFPQESLTLSSDSPNH